MQREEDRQIEAEQRESQGKTRELEQKRQITEEFRRLRLMFVFQTATEASKHRSGRKETTKKKQKI